MRRTTVFLIGVLSFLLLPTRNAAADEPYPFFQTLTTSDGLSQISVISICQDHRGYMWFGTRNGLNRYDGKTMKVYSNIPGDTSSLSNDFVRCIVEDRHGRLWIGTLGGVNLYDPSVDGFHSYELSPEGSNFENVVRTICPDAYEQRVFVGGNKSLAVITDGQLEKLPWSGTRISSMVFYNQMLLIAASDGLHIYNPETYEDKLTTPFSSAGSVSVDDLLVTDAQEIWASNMSAGVARIDPSGNLLEWYDIQKDNRIRSNEVRTIEESPDGVILVGTDLGLMEIDRKSGIAAPCKGLDLGYTVEAIFTDSIGDIWIGTYSEGVLHSSKFGGEFNFYDPRSALSSRIGSINCIDYVNGIVWLGTEGGGILTYDSASKRFSQYPCVAESHAPFRDNNVKSMLRKGDKLYAGLYSGWIYVMDVRTRKYVAKYHNPTDKPVSSLIEGKDGEIIIGTFGNHPVKVLKSDGTIEDYPCSELDKLMEATCLTECRERLFIGTKGMGLFRLQDGKIEQVSLKKGNNQNGNISCLCTDSEDNVYVGTYDSGVYRIDKDNVCIPFGNSNMDSGQYMVRSLSENPSGGIWAVSKKRITLLSKEGTVISSFNSNSGIKVNEFSDRSICCVPGGDVYVGGINGFLSFAPDRQEENMNIPKIVIESISVNTSILKQDLDAKPSVVLKSTENNLTISYRALNYIYPDQNRYKCKIEGKSKASWVDMGGVSSVSYQNLRPGRYRFTVIGSNNNGVWNETGASIDIRIKPPFYLSVPAILLYIILFMLIIYLIVRTGKAREELGMETFIKEQERNMFESKIELFTNFSHELRTPLTLIKAPVDEALHSADAKGLGLNSVKMIQGNVNRMMLLIDQIMMFRKEESGTLKLSVSAGDFVGFAREMKVSFVELAHSRSISLNIEERLTPPDIWYDRALFERVFMNLLSNAFKYTEDGEEIKITLSSLSRPDLNLIPTEHSTNLYLGAADYLKVTIEDSGRGIKEEDIDKIFEPFFQSDGAKSGTGIGLALSKWIVNMHHGALWAENRTHGGARFTIVLPSGCTHFKEDEINKDYKDSENLSRYDRQSMDAEGPGDEIIEPMMNCSVLVIDDNYELREYIAKRLSRYFKVYKAANGQEGLIIAKAQMPTLILSDIMMPVLDGLQMCREIKEDPSMNHIPVILLTARAFTLQMKEGLNYGADDYITKPFDMETLIVKISNMIKSRENLKKMYAVDLSLKNMGIELNSSDDLFLSKLNEVISKHISDPELDVESLCAHLGMSRPSLYRRMQAAAHVSPSHFLQTVRLHLAAKMLKETDLSVYEIMDACGFSNPTYFTSLFKNKYGSPPIRYRKESRNQTSDYSVDQ